MGADNTFGETHFNPSQISLGATTMIRDGIKYDYNFRETILNLQAFADQVVICVVETDDGTLEAVREIADHKTKIIVIDDELWQQTKGKERLSYFSNIAIANLDTDWNMYVQCDEILHESSFDNIRKAIELPYEAFLIRRLNLWNDPYHYLPDSVINQPCSTWVIRLAKSGYRCVGDAESIDAQAVQLPSERALLYHMGFVRHRKVMKQKVINIQENIFDTPHDSRLDVADEFRPLDYFKLEDLAPIPLPLPKHIEEWAKKRLY